MFNSFMWNGEQLSLTNSYNRIHRLKNQTSWKEVDCFEDQRKKLKTWH